MTRLFLLPCVAVCALAQNPAFSPLVSYPAQQAPLAITAADFNGDGILDLAMANAQTPSISVYLGASGGTFSAQAIVPVPGTCTPAYITSAKFTGAASADLVVVCALGAVIVFPNTGKGTFGTAHSTLLPAPAWVGNLMLGSIHPAIADFNKDGKLDLALPAFGDDLLASTGSWYLMLGNGNGSFQTPTPLGFNGYLPFSVAAGDFNGDGNVDLIAGGSDSNGNNSLELLIGNGDGTFSSPLSTPAPAGVGTLIIPVDVDGDNKLDVVVAGSALVSDILGLEQTVLGVTSSTPFGASAVTTFLGDGQGHFKQQYNATEQTYMSGAALANVLGSGKLDLVETVISENIGTSNPPTGAIEVRPGNGDGTFGNPITLPVSSAVIPTDLSVADFNGDGKPDIAFSSVPAQGISNIPLTTDLTQVLGAILSQFPLGNASVLLNTAGSTSAPSLTSGSLANGATYLAGGLVSGSWAQVKGTHLANVTNYIWQAVDFAGLGNNLPTNLKGTQVLVNGQPAAVYYVDPAQINFQVPSGVSGTASVQVVVSGVTSNTVTAASAANSPGIFPVTLNGVNYAGGSFPDGTLLGDSSVSPAFRYAKPGDEFQLFATGIAPSAAGIVVASDASITGVTVNLGSTTVTPDFQGLVGVGLFQINFKVPSLPAGTYPITLTINGVTSPSSINSSAPGPVVFPIQP